MTDEETKAAGLSCPEVGGEEKEDTAVVAGEETFVPEATEKTEEATA